MTKNRVFHHCLLALRSRSGSRSKVRVMGQGQGQISGAQRSILGVGFVECSKEDQTSITSLRGLSVCL